jgi:hypothetical protein
MRIAQLHSKCADFPQPTEEAFGEGTKYQDTRERFVIRARLYSLLKKSPEGHEFTRAVKHAK